MEFKLLKNAPARYYSAIDPEQHVDVYEAEAELPNDGTPQSERYLRVRVIVYDSSEEVEIELATYEPFNLMSDKVKIIGSFVTENFAKVANMLYPAAKVEKRLSLVPSLKGNKQE
jgi:hypothetical protein